MENKFKNPFALGFRQSLNLMNQFACTHALKLTLLAYYRQGEKSQYFKLKVGFEE